MGNAGFGEDEKMLAVGGCAAVLFALAFSAWGSMAVFFAVWYLTRSFLIGFLVGVCWLASGGFLSGVFSILSLIQQLTKEGSLQGSMMRRFWCCLIGGVASAWISMGALFDPWNGLLVALGVWWAGHSVWTAIVAGLVWIPVALVLRDVPFAIVKRILDGQLQRCLRDVSY